MTREFPVHRARHACLAIVRYVAIASFVPTPGIVGEITDASRVRVTV